MGFKVTAEDSLALYHGSRICSTHGGKQRNSMALEELGYKQDNCVLNNDSQSAIHLTKNAAFHAWTKHIEVRYHFIRTLLEEGQLKLAKIHTSKNPADMLTKVVNKEKLTSICIQN